MSDETQEAVELAKAYINAGDDDALAVWKACEVFRGASPRQVNAAIKQWA